jgi:hypothetical protein
VIRSGGDDHILATFPDAATAQQCLELMQAGPTFEQQRIDLQGEFRRWRDRAAADQLALLDLMLHGRV